MSGSDVDLCVQDIAESAYGLEEMDRVAKLGYKKDAKAWKDKYLKERFFENVLYLFHKFGFTIEDFENYNKENKIFGYELEKSK